MVGTRTSRAATGAVAVVAALLAAGTAGAAEAKQARQVQTTPVPDACRQASQPGTEHSPEIALSPDGARATLVHVQEDVDSVSGVALGVADVVPGGDVLSRLVPGATRCSGGAAARVLRAGVTRGPDGLVLVSYVTTGDEGNRAMTSTSRDGGTTFEAPVLVAASEPAATVATRIEGLDVAADPTRPGVAHAVFTKRFNGAFPINNQLLVSTTTDGGRTWGAPQVLVDPGRPQLGRQRAVVTPDGTLVVVYLRADPGMLVGIAGFMGPAGLPAPVRAVRSTDGGRTFSAPVDLGTAAGFAPRDPDRAQLPGVAAVGFTLFGNELVPAVAAGRDGSVFAAWEDTKSEVEGQVQVRRSTDGGATWQALPAPGGNRKEPVDLELAVHDRDSAALTFYDLESDVRGDGKMMITPQFADIARGRSWEVTPLAPPFDGRNLDGTDVGPLGGFVGPGTATGLAALPDGSYLSAVTELPGGADPAVITVRRVTVR